MKILKIIEGYLIAIMLLIIALLIFVDVLARNIISISSAGVEEISVILFIYIIFLTASVATREGIHIEVDTLFNKLSHKNRIVTSLISEILTVIFFITLTIIGIKLTMAHWLFTTPTYEFPMSVLSFPLPASASLMAVYTVNKIIRLWGRYKELSR